MRCFIGFELEEDCRERMRIHVEPFYHRLQREMGWPVRLVPSANWHMTALFFKDLTAEERGVVWQEVLRNVEAGVWDDLMFPWEGLVLWPTPRKPSLICLTAPVAPQVNDWPLLGRVQEAPFNKGDIEHLQTYRPHITIMRFRGGPIRPYFREWQALGTWVPQVPASAVRFNRVSMLLSDVSASKPIYTREYTAKLKTHLKPLTERRHAMAMLEE